MTRKLLFAAFVIPLLASCGGAGISHERIMHDWVDKEAEDLKKAPGWKCPKESVEDGVVVWEYCKKEVIPEEKAGVIRDEKTRERKYTGPGKSEQTIWVVSRFYMNGTLNDPTTIRSWRIEKMPPGCGSCGDPCKQGCGTPCAAAEDKKREGKGDCGNPCPSDCPEKQPADRPQEEPADCPKKTSPDCPKKEQAEKDDCRTPCESGAPK